MTGLASTSDVLCKDIGLMGSSRLMCSPHRIRRVVSSGQIIDLGGRVALVTGAGSGIGAAIATELARARATVVLVGRRADRLEQVSEVIAANGGRALPLPWDIGRGDDAEELVTAAAALVGDDIDVLAHAAGNQIRKPATDMTLADFDSVVGIHLRAAFALSRAVARPLIARGRPGSVLYVGSMTSARVGLRDTVAYGAAKSGLLGLHADAGRRVGRPWPAGEHGSGRLRGHGDDTGHRRARPPGRPLSLARRSAGSGPRGRSPV